MTQRTARTRRIAVLLGVLAFAAAAGYVVTWAIFPAPIVARPKTVPALRGVTVDAATGQLNQLGLRGRLADTVPDPLTPAGTIAWQSPAPETMLPTGSVVRLGVSSGTPNVAMPDIGGLDLALAGEVLAAAGLRVGSVDTVEQDDPFGTVVEADPRPSSSVRAGDAVQLTISSGPANIRVPDLTGLTLTAARERLRAAGLRLGALTQRFDGPAGAVLAQHPAPGELHTRETAVDLTISGTIP